MAQRNSVTRLVPDNPLASVLRETAREARRSTRGDVALDCCDTVAELQQQNASLQQQIDQMQRYDLPLGHAVVRTDGTGNATWVFPRANPFPPPAAPIVHATVLELVQILVVVTSVTQTSMSFRTFESTSGTTWPNTRCFLTAFPSNIVP